LMMICAQFIGAKSVARRRERCATESRLPDDAGAGGSRWHVPAYL
jgi:hypothetical protein